MNIHAVVVTYHPGDLTELLTALATQCGAVTVVDNTEGGSDGLGRLAENLDLHLITLGQNVGIAAAQNIGISEAMAAGAEAILLSDQDSIIPPAMVTTLAAHLAPGVAAVGPVPVEGDDILVYTDHAWGPKRPTRIGADPFEVSFLLASGSLISTDVLATVGMMDGEYFIDHVDLAWSMRARRHGYRLLAVPAATLTHSLGDSVVKVPGRSQVVHIHSPIRNYYLTRNTIALMKNPDLPRRWRIRYGYWIARFIAFNLLVNPDRAERARAFAAGLAHGLRGRMGRKPSRAKERGPAITSSTRTFLE